MGGELATAAEARVRALLMRYATPARDLGELAAQERDDAAVKLRRDKAEAQARIASAQKTLEKIPIPSVTPKPCTGPRPA